MGSKSKSKNKSKKKSGSNAKPSSVQKVLSTAFGQKLTGKKAGKNNSSAMQGVSKTGLSNTQQKRSKKEQKRDLQRQRAQAMLPPRLAAVSFVMKGVSNAEDDFVRHFRATEKTKESTKNSVALAGGSFSSNNSNNSSIASSLGLPMNACSFQNTLAHEKEVVDVLFDHESGMVLSVGRDEQILLWGLERMSDQERDVARSQLLSAGGNVKAQSNIFGQTTTSSSIFGQNIANPMNPGNNAFSPEQVQKFTPCWKLMKQPQSLQFPAAPWSSILDSNCLFTGMGDGTVRVQEKTTSENFTFVAHDKRVTCVRRHATSGYIMTAGAEGCFKLWTMMKDPVNI